MSKKKDETQEAPEPAQEPVSDEETPAGDPYPLMEVTPAMVDGGDWQTYRPSLQFRAKTMAEPGSVRAKAGVVEFEAGDVVAVVDDDLHVFSGSVFASEYEPVSHGT